MNAFGILDLVIGLFFIYFVLSVICTALVEGIAQWRSWRNAHLEGWINDTFQGPLGEKLLRHGLINGLTQANRKADYIPAHIFTAALLDIVHRESDEPGAPPPPYDFKRLEHAIKDSTLLPVDFKQFLLQALHESQNHGGSLALLRRRLETWYGDAMDRLTGTYKKRTRLWTWIIALCIAFAANADTILLCKYLKDNPKTTSALVQAANRAVQDSLQYHQVAAQLKSIEAKMKPDSSPVQIDSIRIAELLDQLQKSKRQSDSLYQGLLATGLPLGWDNPTTARVCSHATRDCSRFWCQVRQVVLKLFGLLLTALALTLGAPFWFDMINKLVNIRSAGNKPDDSASNPKNTPVG